jgi:hypothetical protein
MRAAELQKEELGIPEAHHLEGPITSPGGMLDIALSSETWPKMLRHSPKCLQLENVYLGKPK